MSPITKFDVNLRFQFAGSSVSFRFDSSTLSIEATAATPFKSVENCNEEEGIKEFRVKIMSDLKMVRNNIIQFMYTLVEDGFDHPTRPEE